MRTALRVGSLALFVAVFGTLMVQAQNGPGCAGDGSSKQGSAPQAQNPPPAKPTIDSLGLGGEANKNNSNANTVKKPVHVFPATKAGPVFPATKAGPVFPVDPPAQQANPAPQQQGGR